MVASWLGCLTVLMLFTLAAPDASSAEPPPRAPLDALWQEHMLTGSAATIYVDESGHQQRADRPTARAETDGRPHEGPCKHHAAQRRYHP